MLPALKRLRVQGSRFCTGQNALQKKLHMDAQAANAGGVAVSGLEMCQNSARLSWTSEKVDDKLHTIMVRASRHSPKVDKFHSFTGARLCSLRDVAYVHFAFLQASLHRVSHRINASSQRAVLSLQADIFKASKAAAKEFNTHLQGGANIAGFLKVADAMVRVPG